MPPIIWSGVGGRALRIATYSSITNLYYSSAIASITALSDFISNILAWLNKNHNYQEFFQFFDSTRTYLESVCQSQTFQTMDLRNALEGVITVVS